MEIEQPMEYIGSDDDHYIHVDGSEPVLLEHIGRTGAVLHRYRIDHLPVTLGRAYSNDIILDDPYVEGVHAELFRTPEGQLQIRDLNSTNGVHQGRHKVSTAGDEVMPGVMLTLGKSHVRVLDRQAEVAPAIPISLMEMLFHTFSKPWMVIIGLLLVAALSLAENWLDGSQNFAWQQHLQEAMYLIIAVLAYGGCWALVSRVLRHDSRFWGHCMAAVLAMIFTAVLTALLLWLAFNWQWLYAFPYLEAALAGAVAFFLLRVNLFMATHLVRWRLSLAALVVPVLIVLIPVASLLFKGDGFSRWPQYPANLMPPALHSMQGIQQADFMQQADALFSKFPLQKQPDTAATKPGAGTQAETAAKPVVTPAAPEPAGSGG